MKTLVSECLQLVIGFGGAFGCCELYNHAPHTMQFLTAFLGGGVTMAVMASLRLRS